MLRGRWGVTLVCKGSLVAWAGWLAGQQLGKVIYKTDSSIARISNLMIHHLNMLC